LGVSPRALYDAGVTGALCDEATRTRLHEISTLFDWEAASDIFATGEHLADRSPEGG
jgi:aminodeoxyfutalosine deaminase